MHFEIDQGDENPTNTLFVGTFLHDIHLAFAHSIDADILYLFGREYEDWEEITTDVVSRLMGYTERAFSLPTDYDRYLLEGGTTLLPILPFQIRASDADFILLNADETYINMAENLEHYGRFDATAHRLATYALDGVMSIGAFADKYFQCNGFELPSEVVHPGIGNELYDRLGEVEPNIGSRNIVVVAYGKNHPRRTGGSSTGLDLLVKAIPEVREVHPNAELHIAGLGHPDKWEDQEGVNLHGWVENLPDFFSRGEVSCHPGRSESFSIAAIEPIRAGCPCIVSEMVGAKEIVRDVHPDLICEPTKRSITNALNTYFNQSIREREQLSLLARKAVNGFKQDKVTVDFAEKYDRLLEQLN